MAIWEKPGILSGEVNLGTNGDEKPVVGICMIHTGDVRFKWAMNWGETSRSVGYPYVYFHNSNQPYDGAREVTTRACLERGVEWVFHYDTDVILPPNTIPNMIHLAKEQNKDIISGLYWAKKPEPTPIMPAAWLQIGEDLEKMTVQYQHMDMTKLKPYLSQNALLQCDVVGAGCLLIKADVFKKLDKSNPNLPYFQWGLGRRDPTGKPLLQVSEDFYFCHRATHELKIYPHLATAIKCGHICSDAEKSAADGVLRL